MAKVWSQNRPVINRKSLTENLSKVEITDSASIALLDDDEQHQNQSYGWGDQGGIFGRDVPFFLYPASQINHYVHDCAYLKSKSGKDQPISRLFFHGFHRVY